MYWIDNSMASRPGRPYLIINFIGKEKYVALFFHLPSISTPANRVVSIYFFFLPSREIINLYSTAIGMGVGKHIFSQRLQYIAFLKLQQGRIHWMRESSFKHKMETAKKSINFRTILLGPKVMLSQFCSACVLRVKKETISPWISEHFICSNVGISTSTEAGGLYNTANRSRTRFISMQRTFWEELLPAYEYIQCTHCQEKW